jgi:hypothetical protein
VYQLVLVVARSEKFKLPPRQQWKGLGVCQSSRYRFKIMAWTPFLHAPSVFNATPSLSILPEAIHSDTWKIAKSAASLTVFLSVGTKGRNNTRLIANPKVSQMDAQVFLAYLVAFTKNLHNLANCSMGISINAC